MDKPPSLLNTPIAYNGLRLFALLVILSFVGGALIGFHFGRKFQPNSIATKSPAVFDFTRGQTAPMIWSGEKRDSLRIKLDKNSNGEIILGSGTMRGYSMTSALQNKSEDKISSLLVNNNAFTSQGFFAAGGGEGQGGSYVYFVKNMGDKKQLLFIEVGDIRKVFGTSTPISYGAFVFLSDAF